MALTTVRNNAVAMEDGLEAEGCSLRQVEKDSKDEKYGNCGDGCKSPRNGPNERIRYSNHV